MKILLTGGSTGGSVVPLIAVASELKKRNKEVEFLFIGTRKGIPEKNLIKPYRMEYKGIYSGKLRRYFSWQNFLDPFFIIIGFFQNLYLLFRYKPCLIFATGSFVSVPVVWAGFFLKIPGIIHQQDIIPSLSNKLLSPLARKITVSFKESLDDFPKDKTVLVGNPVRKEVLLGQKDKALKRFSLEDKLPCLLVIGGGKGAKRINELIIKILPDLTKFCQVIHLTGKDKYPASNRYHAYKFLTEEMADAYAVADLVVARAGLGTLTELSALSLPTILIPIEDSHQVVNAEYFAQRKAVVFLEPKKLTPEVLLEKISRLLSSPAKQQILADNIGKLYSQKASSKIASLILETIESQLK